MTDHCLRLVGAGRVRGIGDIFASYSRSEKSHSDSSMSSIMALLPSAEWGTAVGVCCARMAFWVPVEVDVSPALATASAMAQRSPDIAVCELVRIARVFLRAFSRTITKALAVYVCTGIPV